MLISIFAFALFASGHAECASLASLAQAQGTIGQDSAHIDTSQGSGPGHSGASTGKQGSDFFYQRFSEPKGWFWYRENKVLPETESEKKHKKPAQSVQIPLQDIRKWKVEELGQLPSSKLILVVGKLPVAQLRQLAKFLLDQAMEPSGTYDDVRKYMVTHREILARSDLFSTRWKDILITDPYFDFPMSFIPTSAPAQDIWAQVMREQREQNMARIARETILVLFSDDTPYSAAQRQTLDKLADEYNFKVTEISRDKAEEKGWKLNTYPTVFLYLKSPSKIIRLGSHYITYSELKRRILRAYQLLTAEGNSREVQGG